MLNKIIAHKKYILIIALAVYIPTLFFGYVYLDDYLVVQEPGFHNKLSSIPASFFRSLWAHTSTAYAYYRPFSISLYILGTWISQQISGETLPWIYHLTNFALQGTVIALLYTFFVELKVAARTAGLITLLFAVHPAMAGAICWIPGQNELLLAVLILASLIAILKYLKNSKRIWFFLHGLFFLLAMLTKENAIGLPLLSAVYLLSVHTKFKQWPKYIGIWSLVLIIWYLMMKQGAGIDAPVNNHVFSSMIDGLPFILVYLGKIFLPFPLTTLPTYEDTSILTIVAAVIGLMILCWTVYKSKNRWLSFLGASWYLGFLVPTFARAGTYSMDNFILREDRGYLAAIGIWIMFAQYPWSELSPKLKSNFALLIIAIFIPLNLLHQQNYQGGKSFYSNAVEGSPRLPFAHVHLGDMYLAEKDYDKAIASYKHAIQLKFTEYQAHNNLGVAYLRSNKLELAKSEFQLELQINPTNILSWFNYGSILFQEGNLSMAEYAFRKAVTINPVYTDGWNGLATIYSMQKDQKKLEEAQRGLSKSEWDMSKGL